MGISEDITERKKAEDALSESEERFQALFEQAHDAIFLSTLDDRIIEVNERTCALQGYSRDELLRMNISDVQAPEARKPIGTVVRDELERYGASVFESLDIGRNGRRIPIEVTNTKVKTQERELIFSIVRDISERKRAEAAVRKAQEELETRVKERTADLATANLQLKKEVVERKRLEKEILNVGERELRRFGGHLHDGLCQEWTAIAYAVQALE